MPPQETGAGTDCGQRAQSCVCPEGSRVKEGVDTGWKLCRCAVSYSGQIGLNSVNTHSQAFVMPHQIAQVKTSVTLRMYFVSDSCTMLSK